MRISLSAYAIAYRWSNTFCQVLFISRWGRFMHKSHDQSIGCARSVKRMWQNITAVCITVTKHYFSLLTQWIDLFLYAYGVPNKAVGERQRPSSNKSEKEQPGSIVCKLQQFRFGPLFVPGASLYGAIGQNTMTMFNYRSKQFTELDTLKIKTSVYETWILVQGKARTGQMGKWSYCCTSTGPRLNIKTVLSTYGDFHVKDKTAVRTSYL